LVPLSKVSVLPRRWLISLLLWLLLWLLLCLRLLLCGWRRTQDANPVVIDGSSFELMNEYNELVRSFEKDTHDAYATKRAAWLRTLTLTEYMGVVKAVTMSEFSRVGGECKLVGW
jgi:hypothetical protein